MLYIQQRLKVHSPVGAPNSKHSMGYTSCWQSVCAAEMLTLLRQGAAGSVCLNIYARVSVTQLYAKCVNILSPCTATVFLILKATNLHFKRVKLMFCCSLDAVIILSSHHWMWLAAVSDVLQPPCGRNTIKLPAPGKSYNYFLKIT